MNSEIAGQLNEAGTLMLVGMGFVFAFLALLIGGIKLIEVTCRRFPGAPEPVAAGSARKSAGRHSSQEVAPQTIAAISAAIHQHRQAKTKQQENA